MGGGLVDRERDERGGADPGERIRRDFLPQLRLAGGFRAARDPARTLSAAADLHGGHGAWSGQNLRPAAAGGGGKQGGRDRLGSRRRQDADLSARGLVAASVHSRSADGVVP